MLSRCLAHHLPLLDLSAISTVFNLYIFVFLRAQADTDNLFSRGVASGAEEEGPRHRDPCVQVPQGDERLLLPAGPRRGDGLPAPSGGMEAEILGGPDDSAAGVAQLISRAVGRSTSQSIESVSNHANIYPTTTNFFSLLSPFSRSDDSSLVVASETDSWWLLHYMFFDSLTTVCCAAPAPPRKKRPHTKHNVTEKCFEHVGATVEYSNRVRVYSKAMYYPPILVLFLSLVPPMGLEGICKATCRPRRLEEPLKQTEKVHFTSPHVTS